MIRDIVNSCSNTHVACAALASIGGPFAKRVGAQARLAELPPGAYAAQEVRRFRQFAEPRDWADLAFAIRGEQVPVLAGFRFILARSLGESEDVAMTGFISGRFGKDCCMASLPTG